MTARKPYASDKADSRVTTGKTYWAIQIDSFGLRDKVAKDKYFPTLRKLQAELKFELSYKNNFDTEEKAKAVFDALPQYLKDESSVVELTPVHGII
jgi:hypothetical protein